MNCEIFRLVANKASFANPWLQSTVQFQAAAASDAAARVRHFLRMDEAPDFFTIGPVMNLMSTPSLVHELGLSVIPAAAFFGYTRPAFEIASGMTLVADYRGLPRVDRVMTKWPDSLEVTLAYVDDFSARLACGTSSEIIAARISHGLLEIEWPAWSGLAGAINFATPALWQVGFAQTFTVEPRAYPTAVVIAALQKTSYWMTLLSEAGLLRHYASAINDANERMGLIALALAQNSLQ